MNAAAAPAAAPHSRPSYRVTARRVLASEWIKLWSVRSYWVTAALAVIFLIAFGLVAAASYSPASTQNLGSDSVSLALGGMYLVLLTVGVLGVLVTAGEYGTGSIRSTMTAVPRRLPVLWSKAAVTGAVALVLGAVSAVISYAGGEGLLRGGIALPLTASGVLRSLMLAAAAMALIAIMGVGLGSLVRSVGGAIAILAVLLLLPALADLLPTGLRNDISPYLLGNAANSMFSLHQSAGALNPWAGSGIAAAWTAAALAAAAYQLIRTDV